jgi:hypothetical protein
MADWREWSEGWLKEGYFISYVRDGVRYYEHIIMRDLAHWVYDWPETIGALSVSGPFVPEELEITKGYDPKTNTNYVWQVIFGIKGQAYIYIELPTDIHRHGIPKVPKPSTTVREVSHFEEWMSPFHEPSFITEHFMMRPDLFRIAFSAYNPNTINLTDVKLNIFIANMVTERIGTETNGTLSPTSDRWKETLEKLYKRVIPHRPITLYPVRAPAEAPAGV